MGYQETLTGENARKRNLDGVFRVTAGAVAQGATGFTIVGKAPFTGKIAEVKLIPNTALAGADTNTRRHRLYNRKGDNSGTTVAADLQYNAGTDLAAKTPNDIPLSATASDLNVTEGDVLEFNSSAVGTGIADGGGLLEVRLVRSV